MMSLKPAYADAYTLTIKPSPVGANQPITFTAGSSDASLRIYSGSGCTGTQLYDISVSEFGFTYTLTAGLAAGSYSSTDNGLVYCVNFAVLPTSDTVPTATGVGTATFMTTAGGFSSLTASPVSSISTPPPSGAIFPDGLFSFTIQGLSSSQTVTITITLPAALPAGTFAYYKFQVGAWIPFPSAYLDVSRTIITLTLTADSSGTINDPGGPAIPTSVQPALHPVYVGGAMLSVNPAQVLGPWIAAMLALTVVAVETLIIRRKNRKP